MISRALTCHSIAKKGMERKGYVYALEKEVGKFVQNYHPDGFCNSITIITCYVLNSLEYIPHLRMDTNFLVRILKITDMK